MGASVNKNLSSINNAVQTQNTVINEELSMINKLLVECEGQRDYLLNEIGLLKAQKDKDEEEKMALNAQVAEKDKLKEEFEELTKKLQFSLSNAKRQEKEHESVEALLVASEEEKVA